MAHIFVFFTHAGAIGFKKKCDEEGVRCTLMPVPRKLSNNCGIGAEVEGQTSIEHLITEEVEKIFQGTKEKAVLIYEA